jgi:hypothetical protein
LLRGSCAAGLRQYSCFCTSPAASKSRVPAGTGTGTLISLGPLVPSKKNKKMNKTKADFHESSHTYKKKTVPYQAVMVQQLVLGWQV